MTQEDKELLLKDLCARLPYGVTCQIEDEIRFIGEKSPYYDYILSERHIDLFRNHKDFYIKPYLRPMSSMTEEERNEYFSFRNQELQRVAFAEVGREEAISEVIDWLNAHHFDYRGLIEKGLALEAPEDMYNFRD